MTGKLLRIVLGDQLNIQHSWFSRVDPSVTYLLVEARSETDYAVHHIQKVCAFFCAMRLFADELRRRGHEVRYLKLDDPDNRQSFTSNIKWMVEREQFTAVEYQEPDEWRLDQEFLQLAGRLSCPTSMVSSEHFYTSREEFGRIFQGKKQLLMESFYREMRRKHQILMDGSDPVGGRWNFDAENRKKLPKNFVVPEPLIFENEVSDIVELLRQAKVKTIGSLKSGKLGWPVTREQSLEALDYFCRNLLPLFGTYQDAMHAGSPFLFHSRLSFALNVKLIAPAEVVDRVVRTWKESAGAIDISQVEGFVRQILGWREYMRGFYWNRMPAFGRVNFFEHKRKLPGFYWTGETKMRCLSQAISQSLDEAYAHHIQRLMVTGNFALMAGIDPDEVDAWYLGIYVDAIEWVEITNTRGMSQYADGGSVATKPYVASANYISKMSNYCDGCFYDKQLKSGDRACPLNGLYWHFLDRHAEKFKSNPRMGMPYKVLNAMDAKTREAVLRQAERNLERMEEL
jgi:deoxyribodipyrimidine photolyase-related protein